MQNVRAKPLLEPTDAEAAQLQSSARSRSLPASLMPTRGWCWRAQVARATAIAARLELSKATVGKWRASFTEKQIAGLYDDVRPGRLRSLDRRTSRVADPEKRRTASLGMGRRTGACGRFR